MPINIKIFTTLFLAIFFTTLGVGLVVPLLPVYAHELGAGAFQVGLVFAAFSLTRSMFVPYFGKLSDKKGKKPFLTTGLFIFFFLSILYTYSKNIETLILLRLGQGFASAMVLPVAQAYIGIMTPPQKEGRVMGLFSISLYGGLSIGPLLGGVVKDWFSINASFLSMGALCLLGFVLCLLFLPREGVLQESNPSGSGKPKSYLAIVKTPAILSLFTFRICFTTCIGIIWTFLPLFANTMLDLSSSAIGFVIMINVFIAGLLQAPMGYIADRFSKKIMVTAGGVLAIISLLCLNYATSFNGLVIANGIFGLAGGISLPAIMALGIIEGRKTKAMGAIMGILTLAHSLGMLVGPLLAGIIIDVCSMETIFITGAAILGAGTIVFLRNHKA
ncbi:MAG: MFS transporter [Desulfobacteraceae bacterium]|nr:MAG: MFS transporter [Desulfobacteraceae bacterium]